MGGETPGRSWRTLGTVGKRTVGTSEVGGVRWKEEELAGEPGCSHWD